MAIADYFDTLTEPSFAMDVGTVLTAYMGTSIGGPMVDGFVPVDLPNEAYGIATIVAAEATLSGSRKVLVQYGGGFHTLETLADRFGVKDALEDLGGSA